MSVSTIAFLLTLVIFCVQLALTRSRKNLRDIPGPFIASFTNFWKVWAVYHGDMPRRNREAHEKYGPVVRIGPSTVSCSSLDALHTIHSSREAFAKSAFYDPTSPIYNGHQYTHLFSIRDVGYHSSLRKRLASLYTKTASAQFEPQIDKCTMLFCQKIGDMCRNGPVKVDMSLWPHFYAFDSLGEINLSRKFGFLDSGTDVRGMIATADHVLHMTGLYSQAPMLHALQKPLKRLWISKGPNPLLVYSINQVKNRQSNPTTEPDMLNHFLKLQESSPDKVTTAEISGAIYINLMAGHDVLAVTLRTIFYYLARDPAVADRVRADLKKVSAGYSDSEPLPLSQVNQCRYVEAVINEALRIHPNTGLILEREVPAHGAVIDGYALPGGTLVGVNAWQVNFDRAVFGEDVEVFRPERWLEADEPKLAEMKRTMFSFGAGPRGCIGRNIAMIQASKFVAEFYRRFDAQLVDPGKEWNVKGGWVTKQTDMDMWVGKRGAVEEKIGVNGGA